MPEGLLTVLRWCFLALCYLFLWRVLRVITLELRVERLALPPAVEAAPAGRGGGRPGPERRGFRLTVVAPESRAGQVFTVTDEESVGRAPGCGVRIDDTYVSQVHARLFRQDRHLFVEDLGSTNGTLVNGTRIDGPVRLRRGDRIQVGGVTMEVGR